MKTHKQMLSDLLAHIHRDGGHYEREHGTETAVVDAITKVCDWIHGNPQEAVQADANCQCKDIYKRYYPAIDGKCPACGDNRTA